MARSEYFAAELAQLRGELAQAEDDVVAAWQIYDGPHKAADEQQAELNAQLGVLDDRGIQIRSGLETSIGWDQHLAERDAIEDERRTLRTSHDLAAAIAAREAWKAAYRRRDDLRASLAAKERECAPYAAEAVEWVASAYHHLNGFQRCYANYHGLGGQLRSAPFGNGSGGSGGVAAVDRVLGQLEAALSYALRQCRERRAYDPGPGAAVLETVRAGTAGYGDLSPYLPGGIAAMAPTEPAGSDEVAAPQTPSDPETAPVASPASTADGIPW